jgi:hypothetical protein
VSWLADGLGECCLSNEHEGYLRSRGAKETTIFEMGFATWTPPPFDISEPTFVKRYGPRGGRVRGCLCMPFYSPRGSLIGVQFRNTATKWISRFLLESASWNPVWIGAKRATPKIWKGAGIWIVEGVYDYLPLEWAVPEGDAILAAATAKLSWSHVEYLRRLNPPFVNLVFDNDEAGQNGMKGYTDKRGKKVWGAVRNLNHVGVRCQEYVYGKSGDKDPGDIWDRGGVVALQEAFRRY